MKDFESMRGKSYESLVQKATFMFPTGPTRRTYDILFKEGKVQTPIETVKMGEEQFNKFVNNWNGNENRKYQMGMARQTPALPDLVFMEIAEKGSCRVYVRSHASKDCISMLSVVAMMSNGSKVSVSSHFANSRKAIDKIKNVQNLIYADKELDDTTCIKAVACAEGANLLQYNPLYDKANVFVNIGAFKPIL